MKRPQLFRNVPRAVLAAALLALAPSAHARPRPRLAAPATHHAARARAPKPPKIEKGPEANAKYLDEAKTLDADGKTEEALAAYDHALEALPDDVQTLEDYGRALYAHGKLDDAAAKFKRIVEVAKDQPVASYNLAFTLAKKGDFAGAEASYRQYLAAVPDDPDGLYNLAECLRLEGKSADAATLYDSYVQHEKRPEEAAFVDKAKAKAASLRGGGTGVVATSRPESVTTISSNDQTPKTTTETVTSEPTLAERAPTATVAAAPAVTVAMAAPAPTITAAAPQPTPVAVAAPAPTITAPAPVTTTVTAPAPNASGGLLAGAGLQANGDTVVSTPAAPAASPESFVSRDPTAAIAKIREGDAYFTQKQFREALFAYQDAVKLDDQSVNAILKMGLAYANLNYLKEAVEKWNRVLELDPANRYAKVYIQRAQERMNAQAPQTPSDQPQPVGVGTGVQMATAPAAAPAAAPAVAVSPEAREAARNAYRRAVADMGQSRFAEAVTELTTAIQQDPTFVNAYVARGGAYLGARSYSESAADYQKSLELDSTLATPLYGLGRAFDKLGDRGKACDFYRRYARSTGRDAQPALQEQAKRYANQLCG